MFRVWGLEFRVQALGFTVQGVGLRHAGKSSCARERLHAKGAFSHPINPKP